MIPKTIHYCWFGGKPITPEVQKYLDTWKRHFPDFEIKRWDESNFDINARLYTRQAYFAKKFAFVSDVARLYALLQEGGLYLDTDIIIKKEFPKEWFEFEGFGSFEHDRFVQTGLMATAPGNSIIRAFIGIYDTIPFFRGISYDLTTNVHRFTTLMENRGFRMNNQLQTIDGFTIFPQQLLCGKDWQCGRYDDDSTYAVHDYAGMWGKEILKHRLRYWATSITTILRWHLVH